MNAPITLWTMRLIGAVLIAAAAMKAYDTALEPISLVGPFASPTTQIVLINCEFLVGFGLISGQQPLAAWCAGMRSFASFAAASLYFGLAGRASCGCFGAVHVNPWLALGLDLVILTGLFIGRPDLRPLRV